MELAQDFFQENMAQLQEHHPQAWQAVADYAGEPLGEFCLSEDGKPNLLVRLDSGDEIFMHYQQSPLSELAEYNMLVPAKATGVVMFIGMGLGYTPPVMLLKPRQIRHMAVFEPETAIFIQALHALDLRSLFTDPRVSIAVGPDIDVSAVLFPMIQALHLENIIILKHTPCFRLFPETYQAIHRTIFQSASAKNITGNTTKAFGKYFFENRLRHLKSIHHQRLLEDLKGTFAGVPAILVAGGPSLDKNVHLLSQAKGKAVIIAADTALPALLANDVIPDFITCIDAQDLVLEKIIDVSSRAGDTALVCGACVNGGVPKNFPARQVYWTFNEKSMEKWLNGILGGKVLTSMGGTVAKLSFDTAILMGCSPIIFVGQDLTFAGQQSHARHTSLTSRKRAEQIAKGIDVVWVEGYGGGKVPTSRSLFSYKIDFENAISTAVGRHFINATEGGVRLDDTEELPLHEVLARHCGREAGVPAKIRKAEEHSRMPGRRRFLNELAKTLKLVAELQADVVRLEHVTVKLADEVAGFQEQGAVYRHFQALPPVMQRLFHDLNALNKRLDNTKVWDFLAEITIEGVQNSERLQHEIRQLANQPECFLAWMGKVIERSSLINRVRGQALTLFVQHLKNLQSRLRREHDLLQQLNRPEVDHNQTVLDLLRLYFDDGDFVLLEKTIAAHALDPLASAELSFYLGAIAGNRSAFAAMEAHFATAAEIDSSWSGRIAECRNHLAAHYLGLARAYTSLSQRMLFKAVRYNLENLEVRQMLIAEAAKVLVQADDTDQDPAGWIDDIVLWHRELSANANLAVILCPEQAGALHRCYGLAMAAAGDYPEARGAFAAAVEFDPHNPELHLLLADAAFSMHDYPAGVASLDRAVALDRSCALYWDKLGDDLLASGQPADAVTAYEKGFAALPEEISLIRKIGDGYQAMGQMEAAREAYRLCLEMAGGNSMKN